MTDIQERLFALQDRKYADFQAKLTPGIPPERFIGVRVPEVRKLAKILIREPETERFLRELPHDYYDENMLHGLLISELRSWEQCLAETERFLPYVNNWAVCDVLSPKVFSKHKKELLEKIREWSASDHVYTCRFGIEMLMRHFLDGDFRTEYLAIPAAVQSEAYYVNMMIAWFFATALAKQWDAAIPWLENRAFSPWVQKKTVQKACESYRITPEQKAYLRTLK